MQELTWVSFPQRNQKRKKEKAINKPTLPPCAEKTPIILLMAKRPRLCDQQQSSSTLSSSKFIYMLLNCTLQLATALTEGCIFFPQSILPHASPRQGRCYLSCNMCLHLIYYWRKRIWIYF